MTGRWGQMRQTAMAEVRLDEGRATASRTEKRATRRFGFEQRQLRSNFVRRASMGRKITLENPGIWGMSDYWIDPQMRVTGVILTQILPFADDRAVRLYGQFERQRI